MLAGRKLVLAAGIAPALATLSTSCLCCWTTRAKEMDPPAGAAPARFLYKRNPQAAAWRQKWSQSPVLPSLPFACQANALLVSYAPRNGAGERNRTVVSALARPHSSVEPHPQKMASPAGISPATWSLGNSLCVLSFGDKESNPWSVSFTG